MRALLSLLLAFAPHVLAACPGGRVVDAHSGRGIPGVAVSDGEALVRTDRAGRFALAAVPGRTWFMVKPATHVLPDPNARFWWHVPQPDAPRLRYGGLRAEPGCPVFKLRRQAPRTGPLDVLLFADPQAGTRDEVAHYRRDVVAPLLGAPRAHLGLMLGDIANDELDLYPALRDAVAPLRLPWLHAAGNHDLDFDAPDDAHSLDTFRSQFGPDTFAWEEPEATFVVLDNVVYQPGARPAYTGGLRPAQLAWLERYLASADPARLLVVAMHIPLLQPDARETFRAADRERLLALVGRFPKRIVLSGHGHVLRHAWHDSHGGRVHEFNVGAVSGAFWSGAFDASGIPDATMADGTPNGHARMQVARDGAYRLSWHPARAPGGLHLHAPRVLRRGAYPAFGVFANVYMGLPDTPVQFRVGDGPWRPMTRVLRPDPRLLAENARDDETSVLRGRDRSPEAEPSTHLWRGALPTDLPAGEHVVHVRAVDPWQGPIEARTSYTLLDAP